MASSIEHDRGEIFAVESERQFPPFAFAIACERYQAGRSFRDVANGFGEIERDGKTFDQMQVFLDNREKVLTSIGIPQRSPDLYGSDIRHMRERKLTFEEAISVDLDFNIVEKWRLNRVRRELFEQLAQTPFA